MGILWIECIVHQREMPYGKQMEETTMEETQVWWKKWAAKLKSDFCLEASLKQLIRLPPSVGIPEKGHV